jgi:modulator of FtsH protease
MIRDTMAGAWSTFFTAQVGAGATLTGLVFVALSINLKQILAGPGLPSRAGEALILLMQPVVVGVLVLIPGQSLMVLGIEILIVGILTSYQITKMIWNTRGVLVDLPVWQRTTRIGFAEGATLPTLVAGAMLIGGVSQGLYVETAALVLCILDGVLDAWVLLVEILR